MWQSWVEIEHYSVTYFDCVTAFEALSLSISIKGGAHTTYQAWMQLRNGIMFDFYLGLPQM